MSALEPSVAPETAENQKSEVPADSNKAKGKGKARQGPKAKATFMLHDPDNMSSIGKYQSSDYRYAALKAASKGSTKILLRKTNSKEVRQFAGSIVTLDTPKQISRGDRVINYTKKPTVKFEKKFTFAGDLEDDETLDAQQGDAETTEATT